jgi:hypothetical protein
MRNEMIRSSRAWGWLFAAVVGAAALASGTAWAEELTPLGKWMKSNVGGPMASGDLATVAKSMDFIAGKGPAAYDKWDTLAKQGAEAARKGDTKALKAACKGCHEAYKQKYRAENKERAFP